MTTNATAGGAAITAGRAPRTLDLELIVNQTDPTAAEAEPICKFEQGCHRVVPCAPGCAAVSAVVSPPTDRAAVRDRIVAAIKASPFEELRTTDYANGPLQITVKVDDLADTLLRRLAVEAHDTGTQQPEAEAQPPYHRWYTEQLDPVANEWAPGWRFTDRAEAVERYRLLSEHGTPAERRLVRETTTYTVEEPAPVAQQPAAEADTCHPFEVDGEVVSVRGSGDFTEQERQFAAEIIRAAKRKYATEHPEANEQQPAAADGEETLPPPEGPEYTPCECGHIEPEHEPDKGLCFEDGCDCMAYRPTPPAPLRRSEDDCPGFPERCPNLRPVDPNPPAHYGGIRCGCADA